MLQREQPPAARGGSLIGFRQSVGFPSSRPLGKQLGAYAENVHRPPWLIQLDAYFGADELRSRRQIFGEIPAPIILEGN